jgi:hypothetical protein
MTTSRGGVGESKLPKLRPRQRAVTRIPPAFDRAAPLALRRRSKALEALP